MQPRVEWFIQDAWKKELLTREDSSSAGIRLIWSGEVREERVVRGVRGEGNVSQALQPLGGGLGFWTPERWQHSSSLVIQASKSFSLSQSDTRYKCCNVSLIDVFTRLSSGRITTTHVIKGVRGFTLVWTEPTDQKLLNWPQSCW